jgi:hypothetical protein
VTKHNDSHPITSVINTGELMRQLAQKEADHQRRVQSWTAERVKELTDAAELRDIALHHSDFDVALTALSNDHMNPNDRREVAENANNTRVRDAAKAESTRRGEYRDGQR